MKLLYLMTECMSDSGHLYTSPIVECSAMGHSKWRQSRSVLLGGVCIRSTCRCFCRCCCCCCCCCCYSTSILFAHNLGPPLYMNLWSLQVKATFIIILTRHQANFTCNPNAWHSIALLFALLVTSFKQVVRKHHLKAWIFIRCFEKRSKKQIISNGGWWWFTMLQSTQYPQSILPWI